MTWRLLRLGVAVERRAPHDRQHESRETIVLLRRVAGNTAHERHVLVFQSASKRVRHELFDAHPDELTGIPGYPLPQFQRPVDRSVVEQLGRGVDRRPLIMTAP